MKKLLILLCIGLCFTTGCGKLTTYKEISYEKMNQKLENKESFILFIGSSKCGACDIFKETLNKVIKEKQVDVYYIDVAKTTEEENKKLLLQINYGSSTPTTVFIKNGEEESSYNRINGNKGYDKVIEAFQKSGFLKEN